MHFHTFHTHTYTHTHTHIRTHKHTYYICLCALQEGGLDAFMRVFILQAHSIARAHVSAMGGNALLSYKMNKCVLIEHCQQNKVNHLRYKAQVCTHTHTHMYMCMYMRSTAFVQGGANSNVTAWFEMAYIYVVQCKWFTTLATGRFSAVPGQFFFHTLFA